MGKQFIIRDDFDFSKSTEKNYQSNEVKYCGKYQHERSVLDYTYHRHYTEERQLLQDDIISRFHDTVIIDSQNDGLTCSTPLENWIVFTAGPMGAGKGHTISWLNSSGLFPLDAFVKVDPDAIRHLLPETDEYNRRDSNTAGFLTQKEVGYISEILTYDALKQGKNVLVDGSLRDARWYLEYFKDLRRKFPTLKVAIINVTAKIETVLARAKKRGMVTGRIVPEPLIIEAMRKIPESIELLSNIADFVATFNNEADSPEPVLYMCNMKNRFCNKVLWKLTYRYDIPCGEGGVGSGSSSDSSERIICGGNNNFTLATTSTTTATAISSTPGATTTVTESTTTNSAAEVSFSTDTAVCDISGGSGGQEKLKAFRNEGSSKNLDMIVISAKTKQNFLPSPTAIFTKRSHASPRAEKIAKGSKEGVSVTLPPISQSPTTTATLLNQNGLYKNISRSNMELCCPHSADEGSDRSKQSVSDKIRLEAALRADMLGQVSEEPGPIIDDGTMHSAITKQLSRCFEDVCYVDTHNRSRAASHATTNGLYPCDEEDSADRYLYIDYENHNTTYFDNWKDIFKEVWSMECALPGADSSSRVRERKRYSEEAEATIAGANAASAAAEKERSSGRTQQEEMLDTPSDKSYTRQGKNELTVANHR